MKLLVNRIVAEFNKIFAGTKRVGDSLKLEGRRMSALDVSNASTIGHKSESQLNVNSALSSDKTITIQSFDSSGNPKVNLDGDPVYIKEHQLSVNNSQYLRGMEPSNLEVDIANRLRTDAFRVINVSSLIVDPELYRVKDSQLLGGKTENVLHVERARDADNSDLLNGTTQNQLVVEKSRISSKLLSDNGQEELLESELRVYSSEFIRKGTENLNIYNMRDYFFATEQAKEVFVNLSAASNSLTVNGEGGNETKSFSEIMSYLKDDSDSEIYKATRLITSDTNTPAKTGDQYKTWLIEHNDLRNKVATLTSAVADRAIRFGSDTDNVNIDQMDARIKNTVVTLASNSNKLQNNTVDDIISTTRSRILSNSSSVDNGLTQLEVDGFFGNNKVKLAIQGIEVNSALNSGTLTNTDGISTIDVAGIYQKVKDTGQVLSSKYIYADPTTGGQKSYIDITNDITNAKTDLIDGATSDYMSLSKIEAVIKNNKTDIETSLSGEVSNRISADNTLQSNIDIETARINTILSGADSDKNTFSELKSYIDSLTGDLTTSTTDLGGETKNVVNITNNLEDRLTSFESSTSTNVSSLSGEVNTIETSVGLKTNGGLDNFNGTNYYDSANTVIEAIDALDTYLKVEETNRISQDNALSSLIGTLNDLTTTNKDNIVEAINEEIARAISVEGTLINLNTTNKNDLVSAINELIANLSDEATTRTNSDDVLDTKITNTNTAITTETTNRQNADGNLSTLNTTSKSNLVSAINEIVMGLSTEIANRQSAVTNERNRAVGVEGELDNLNTTASGNLVAAINEIVTNLGAEITNRTSSDGVLQGNINSVLTKQGQIVSGIGYSNILNDGHIEITGTNYLNSTNTTIINTFETIDSYLKSNVDTLQTNIDTESNKIDNVVSGLGFANIDTIGNISFSGTTYLNSVSTINEALSTLDSETSSRFDSLNTFRASAVTDDDFTNDGFLKRLGGSGNYSVDTNSYSLSSHNHDGLYQPFDVNIVSDINYVHTDNNYTTTDATKVGNILTTGDGKSYLSNDGTYKSWDTIVADTASTLSLSSSSTITFDAIDRVKVDNAPFRLPLFTTTERDNLTAINGDMIYNSTLNKFQGYQNGSWINLDGTV